MLQVDRDGAEVLAAGVRRQISGAGGEISENGGKQGCLLEVLCVVAEQAGCDGGGAEGVVDSDAGEEGGE